MQLYMALIYKSAFEGHMALVAASKCKVVWGECQGKARSIWEIMECQGEAREI